MSDVQLRTKAWFGDEPLSINFPPAWNIVEVGPQDAPALSATAMREKLNVPIGSPPLREIAKGKTKCVIIVDSCGRPPPVDYRRDPSSWIK